MKKIITVMLTLLFTLVLIVAPFSASAASYYPCAENDLSEVDRIYELGDVNTDGNISTIDALSVLKYKVGSLSLSTESIKLADVDRSGSVTTVDALYILQYSVKKITSFYSL